MLGAHEFYLKVNGKKISDGQCGSLFSTYCYWSYGEWAPCSKTGMVMDYVNYFHELGLDKHFDLVEVNGFEDLKKKASDGTWAIWPKYVKNNHISMLRNVWRSDGWGVNLTQNTTPLLTDQQYLNCNHVKWLLIPKEEKAEEVDYEVLYKKVKKDYDDLIDQLASMVDTAKGE